MMDDPTSDLMKTGVNDYIVPTTKQLNNHWLYDKTRRAEKHRRVDDVMMKAAIAELEPPNKKGYDRIEISDAQYTKAFHLPFDYMTMLSDDERERARGVIVGGTHSLLEEFSRRGDLLYIISYLT